jgi:hypothetical protein
MSRWLRIVRNQKDLSEGRPGIYGALTARSEAQAIRIALIFALLDGQIQIGIAHLEAALEIVRRSNDSVRYIFGDATGNKVADIILRALRGSAQGMSRRQIQVELFSRNLPAADLSEALSFLLDLKLATMTRVMTNGRPAEVWLATDDRK